MLNCLQQLLGISAFIIYRQANANMFCFLGIALLIYIQRKRHHRDTMIRRLIETVVSHMGDKSFDILVS